METKYDVPGAANYLGLSVQRIRALAKAQTIGEKIGSRWVFTAAELSAFKRRNRPPGRPKGKP